MGWPYIGETFQLYSQNPNVFFASKQKSPEAAKFVLMTRSTLFKPTFPASKERMLGPEAIFFHQGDYHAKLRKLVLRAFMPEAIKSIVSDVESIALQSLSSWDGHFINTFQEMKSYTFNVAVLSIFGKDEILYREELKRCYHILDQGYNSMPINLPGTLFHKSMKARKELGQILANKILCSRKQSKEEYNDLLGSLMKEKEALTDEQIADNIIIGVIFPARDTTDSVLTWTLKYLAENPSILQAVTFDDAGKRPVPVVKLEKKCEEILSVTENVEVWANIISFDPEDYILKQQQAGSVPTESHPDISEQAEEESLPEGQNQVMSDHDSKKCRWFSWFSWFPRLWRKSE